MRLVCANAVVACASGSLTKADGSAYYEQGNTKVMCCVYGPREVKLRSKAVHDRCVVTCEFGASPFATSQHRKASKSDRKHREAALMIRQIFESCILTQQFPRSQISIFIHILQNDGGARAAAINAATLALINAGIPMRDFVTACSAGFVDSTPIIDLNYAERTAGGPELLVAVQPKSGKVVAMAMDNKLALQDLGGVLKLCVTGAQSVYLTLKAEVKEYSIDLLHARGSASAATATAAAN